MELERPEIADELANAALLFCNDAGSSRETELPLVVLLPNFCFIDLNIVT